MQNIIDARKALKDAWPSIKKECLSVLGSELHYQAMIYHSLRTDGNIPVNQIGMNVKMWIDNPVSELFKELEQRKHEDFQGGFEPIPDIVIFKPNVQADWRRRNREKTLLNMLIAIEVKASERKNSRLQPKEIITDIEKLAAHREEVNQRGADMLPIMMVIDSAPLERERMTQKTIQASIVRAEELNVGIMYCSPTTEFNIVNKI